MSENEGSGSGDKDYGCGRTGIDQGDTDTIMGENEEDFWGYEEDPYGWEFNRSPFKGRTSEPFEGFLTPQADFQVDVRIQMGDTAPPAMFGMGVSKGETLGEKYLSIVRTVANHFPDSYREPFLLDKTTGTLYTVPIWRSG